MILDTKERKKSAKIGSKLAMKLEGKTSCMSDTTKTSQNTRTFLIWESWLVGTSLGIFLLLIAGLIFFVQSFAGRIYPAVQIQGLTVGGLTPDEAKNELSKAFTLASDSKVSFIIENRNPEESLGSELFDNETVISTATQAALTDIDLTFSFDQALTEAYEVGREHSLLQRIKSLLSLFITPKHIALNFEYSPEKAERSLEPITSSIFIEAIEPAVTLNVSGDASSLEISPGTFGQIIDFTKVKALLDEQLTYINPIPNKTTVINFTIPLEATIQKTGRTLNDEEMNQTLQKALGLVGKSIVFESDYHPENWVLRDIDLISFIEPPQDISQKRITNFLDAWALETDRKPQEPEFDYNPQTLKVHSFSPPRNGLKLEVSKVAQDITEFMESKQNETELLLPLSFLITEPNTKLGDLNNLGISELIGSGDSTYKGSIPNRAYNVALTANRINNTIIAPGEEFSFNKTLGPVSAQTGFRSAYVIKGGRTELGDGGGVCQVSTTVFRAALDTGLDISKRLQHSYRVGYYEQGYKPGLDATVYSGNIDLRFINDTDHHILIHNSIDETNMSMVTEIFGTSDGRSTEIISHETWDPRPAPPAEYYPTTDLAPGQVRQIDWAVGGIKARVVNQVKNKNGTVIREDEYYSNYIPWSAKYLRGV